jgi:enamine deaminase RidA (YjgF/YER057c/UK114 family)
MSDKKPINPDSLCPPVGFAHGWLVESPPARTLYLAGQCGYDAAGKITHPGDLVAQFDKALENLGLVLGEADMGFSDVVQLNLYVCSRDDYTAARREFGAVWKRHCGGHYPAMAMFVVVGLFDPEALIEIQGVAAG